MKNKEITFDELTTMFRGTSKDGQIALLFEALGLMQQYNGRSIWQCIARAMGYDDMDGEQKRFVKLSFA